MKKDKIETHDISALFEKLIDGSSSEEYTLKLYVSGNTPQSSRAINNIKKICEENLKGHYNLEVIDLYQNPGLAHDAQVIAAPTLVKKLPLPLRRIIGDMSNFDRVLVGLDIKKIQD